MSKNEKHTSPSVATVASEVLRDQNASEIARSLAASALAQVQKGSETSPEMAARAARALEDGRSSETTKRIAATVVSQAHGKRK
jgi:hypothetical protein